MILVIAGTYQQYERWLTRWPELDRKQTKFVVIERDLMGYDRLTTKVVFTGEWWRNDLATHPLIDHYYTMKDDVRETK